MPVSARDRIEALFHAIIVDWHAIDLEIAALDHLETLLGEEAPGWLTSFCEKLCNSSICGSFFKCFIKYGRDALASHIGPAEQMVDMAVPFDVAICQRLVLLINGEQELPTI